MGKIITKKHPTISSQEENMPPTKDEWARKKISFHTHKFDQIEAEVRDIKDKQVFLSSLFGQALISGLIQKVKIDEWERQIPFKSMSVFRPIDIPLNIRSTFEKLNEDFSDFSNRIVWCNELKNCLSKFEEELEEYDVKYLSWFVSTLKDVFSYNYAETITKAQLDLLKKGIEIIYDKQENCDKDSFAEYHLQLVESGLSLLPTTQKAIDEFGE